MSQMIIKRYQKNPQKYNCEVCDYHTSNKKDMSKHFLRKRHGTKWYKTFSTPNPYFECPCCDYKCCSKIDLESHFSETGHSKKSPILSPNQKCKIIEQSRFKCENCNKSYKYKSGYYRHIKECKHYIENKKKIYNLKDNETLINMLIESTTNNSKLCERLLEAESKQNVVQNNTYNNNTYTNQEFNINVFLNQECKDAMSLTDFVDKIQLTLDDITYTQNNGYIKGITNIFIKNLEEMNFKERPIHAISDNKQLYVKEENKWEHDRQSKKLDSSIEKVTKKQINKIKEWESKNENWNTTEKGIDEYMKIVTAIMGGSTETERQENKKQIRRELTETVKININNK